MQKSQARKQHDFLKNIQLFLQATYPARSLANVDPAAAPWVAARIACSEKNKFLAVTPDLAQAESLAGNIRRILDGAKRTRRVLLLGESARGRFFTPAFEAARSKALQTILDGDFDIAVASCNALLAPALEPEAGRAAFRKLTPGMTISFEALLKHLVELDYDDEFEVTIAGEFARRGGIIDVFSPDAAYPCRIEFWGDEITSLRRFDPKTQRSTGELKSYDIIARANSRRLDEAEKKGEETSDAIAYLPHGTLPLELFPEQLDAQLEHLNDFQKTRFSAFRATPGAWKLLDREEDGCANCEVYPTLAHLPELNSEEIRNGGIELLRRAIFSQIEQWKDSGYAVTILMSRADSEKTIREYAAKNTAAELEFAASEIACGAFLPFLKQVLLLEGELVCGSATAENEAARIADAPSAAASMVETGDFDFADFEENAPVVHLAHGIALFRGLHLLKDRTGAEREVMQLEYDEGAILYVPLVQTHLVSRYLGSAGTAKLHKLNTNRWNSDKASARSAIRTYAAELLQLQAVRSVAPGIRHTPDTLETRLFAAAFPHTDTPDQTRAVREIAHDMESDRPMDRLLCGDVGYGKTEVAVRAAYKAVSSGHQVAVLAPTTVLAEQHYRTFSERFAQYPYTVDVLSRFRSAAEQRKLLANLKSGALDIVVGTSALCANGIEFKNLGLVIIDEEQRFGVRQKEKLRSLRAEVDVLTMSATPIPRTLYLAMAGARDLSTLLVAPKARLPVRTIVVDEKDDVIRAALRNELDRKGQAYFLHNRVQSIEAKADALRALVPECRFGVAHGQMDEHQLEEVMSDFIAGRIDCLVCSTIIESGLDIPNANTILIERADKFGLAELYQLRGRVGRSTRQAYSYMLLPRNGLLTPDARKRISAIRRCSNLGAGFQLALRDLEIRGSGNLLGAEQSGHLNAIGFELYCQILKMEIARMGNQKIVPFVDPEVSLDFVFLGSNPPDRSVVLPAAITPKYIESERLRIGCYRKLMLLRSLEEIDDFASELADRYGKLPEEAENLLDYARARLLAGLAQYDTLAAVDGTIYLKKNGVPFRIHGMLPQIAKRNPPKLQMQMLLHLLLAARNRANEP